MQTFTHYDIMGLVENRRPAHKVEHADKLGRHDLGGVEPVVRLKVDRLHASGNVEGDQNIHRLGAPFYSLRARLGSRDRQDEKEESQEAEKGRKMPGEPAASRIGAPHQRERGEANTGALLQVQIGRGVG